MGPNGASPACLNGVSLASNMMGGGGRGAQPGAPKEGLRLIPAREGPSRDSNLVCCPATAFGGGAVSPVRMGARDLPRDPQLRSWPRPKLGLWDPWTPHHVLIP